MYLKGHVRNMLEVIINLKIVFASFFVSVVQRVEQSPSLEAHSFLDRYAGSIPAARVDQILMSLKAESFGGN